jgi:hypothetical protein
MIGLGSISKELAANQLQVLSSKQEPNFRQEVILVSHLVTPHNNSHSRVLESLETLNGCALGIHFREKNRCTKDKDRFHKRCKFKGLLITEVLNRFSLEELQTFRGLACSGVDVRRSSIHRVKGHA